MREKNFFELNDDLMNGRISTVLLLVFVAIPLVALFRATGLFSLNLYEFLVFTIIGGFAMVTPRILYRKGFRSDYLKYYIVTVVSVVISLLAAQPHIGIYISYIFVSPPDKYK